ncbi:hypothetical protein HY374_00970 [Candidatus Berkelbacteria bacterium]|nr:hypothetical protein [Candidatus Berkelbacteria bacterium]
MADALTMTSICAAAMVMITTGLNLQQWQSPSERIDTWRQTLELVFGIVLAAFGMALFWHPTMAPPGGMLEVAAGLAPIVAIGSGLTLVLKRTSPNVLRAAGFLFLAIAVCGFANAYAQHLDFTDLHDTVKAGEWALESAYYRASLFGTSFLVTVITLFDHE